MSSENSFNYFKALDKLKKTIQNYKFSRFSDADQICASYLTVTRQVFEYHCELISTSSDCCFLFNESNYNIELDVYFQKYYHSQDKSPSNRFIPTTYFDRFNYKCREDLKLEDFTTELTVLRDVWEISFERFPNTNNFLIKDLQQSITRLEKDKRELDVFLILSKENIVDTYDKLSLFETYAEHADLFLEYLYSRNLLASKYKISNDSSIFEDKDFVVIFGVDQKLFHYLFKILLYAVNLAQV